jgi:hypothetical protein
MIKAGVITNRLTRSRYLIVPQQVFAIEIVLP